MEMRWAIMFSANSSTSDRRMTSEEMARKRMGASAGLTLRKYGGEGRSSGRSLPAVVMADWTSRAAASMSRSRLNCRVTRVEPRVLMEVMESRPAMVENCFSSGLATEAAMVSGLAPGRDTRTSMVGKSTLGRSETGSFR